MMDIDSIIRPFQQAAREHLAHGGLVEADDEARRAAEAVAAEATADGGCIAVRGFIDSSGWIAIEMGAGAPAPALKSVCAWCGATLREGELPASHDICEDCYDLELAELEPEGK